MKRVIRLLCCFLLFVFAIVSCKSAGMSLFDDEPTVVRFSTVPDTSSKTASSKTKSKGNEINPDYLVFNSVSGGYSVKVREGMQGKITGSVSVPESYMGQIVVAIDSEGFKGCTEIVSITIPNTVTEVGFAAFNGCSSLEQISLPHVGRYRDPGKGNYAESLFGYIFGTTVYQGGIMVDFGYWYSPNPWGTDYNAKNYKENHQYYLPIGLKNVTVTAAKEIRFRAFYNCSMLESINLNDGISTVGNYAFCNCSKIKTITLPGVPIIPEGCLEGCSSLESFEINHLVIEIRDYAFKGCTNLKRINSKKDGVFVIPDNMTIIGFEAFNGCHNITDLTIPFVGHYKDSGRGNYAESLFGYIFGTTVYQGGIMVDFGFWYSPNPWGTDYDARNYKENHQYYLPIGLKNVTVTAAKEIRFRAFYNCTMLANINLNDEITYVDQYAFANCSSIKSINLPSIAIIPQGCFEGCSSLESFEINPLMVEIQNYAFKGCTNLKRINSKKDGVFIVPDNISVIGFEAFNGCHNITDLTIPFVGHYKNSGRGNYAESLFGYIFGTTVYQGGIMVDFGFWYSPNPWGTDYDARNYKENHQYYLPIGLKNVTVTDARDIRYRAFYNCTMISTLKINNTVNKEIGDEAFYNSRVPVYF